MNVHESTECDEHSYSSVVSAFESYKTRYFGTNMPLAFLARNERVGFERHFEQLICQKSV